MPESHSRKKRRNRKGRHPAPLPAPRFSSCLYVRLAPRDVAMFRFLLEAEDNLAFMTTVDRWACVVCVVFSPHHAAAVRRYLETMREAIPFDVILASRDPDTGALPGGATDSRS